MSGWLGTIDVQIPGGLGQHHLPPLQEFIDGDLAPESGSAGQSEGQVQQIFLLVSSSRQLAVEVTGEDDMAGGAGETGLASPL